MSENSKIEWTDHTGGPFMGCTQVSPGCANCYAKELMERRLFPIVRKAYKAAGFADWETRPVWGDTAPRVLSKGFWNDAVRINKKAGFYGEQPRWFPSMIDWLDEMPAGIIDQQGNWLDRDKVLSEFLRLINDTPHITWLLLTKRPENFRKLLEGIPKTCGYNPVGMIDEWLRGNPPPNVWIGVSIENQDVMARRHPLLMKIPAVVRFWSSEPLLGRIDPSLVWATCGYPDWVITGGESGTKARPMHPAWASSLRDQCEEAGVAYFFKQWGEWVPGNGGPGGDLFDRDRRKIESGMFDYNDRFNGGGPNPFRQTMDRVGKDKAGRLLDGREWNGMPTPR